MMQLHRASLFEALANTISGFLISTVLNYFLVPLFFGIPASINQSFWFTFIFTVVTMLRSYVWRRLFNKAEAPLIVETKGLAAAERLE